MKVENKTIIITDPCYIINHDNDPKHPNPLDYGITDPHIGSKPFTEYSTPEELAYKKALDEYYDSNRYNDWDKCKYGENMEALGITNYLSRNTIYGDWYCTTYETGTNKPIGNFCADAGMVAVFELDEIRKYNPNIDKWIKDHPWCVTIIENFTGNVSIDEVEISGIDDEGKSWEDVEVRVIGKGSTNFYTSQTGL